MAKHGCLTDYIMIEGYSTVDSDGYTVDIVFDITKCPNCKKHIETSHGVWVQCRTCGTISVTYGNSIYWGRSIADIKSYIDHRWSDEDYESDAHKNTLILKDK